MFCYTNCCVNRIGVNHSTEIMDKDERGAIKMTRFVHYPARKMHNMRKSYRREWFLVCCIFLTAIGYAQSISSPPPIQFSASDLFRDFRLPPLKDTPDQMLAKDAGAVRVLKRTHTLG